MPTGVYKHHQYQLFQKGHIGYYKGKKLSIEHRKKIGESQKGKTLSKEHRKKLSLFMMGRYVGEKNHLWKGGITKQKNYIKNYSKTYYELHKEQINRKTRLYRLKNKTYFIKYNNNYRKTHPEITKYHHQIRSARIRGLGKRLTINIIQRVYEDNIKKYGTLTCYLCLNPTPFKKDHLEHKIPLSRGGTNDYSNLAISCEKCNYEKHNKTEEEYKLWKEYWIPLDKPRIV